MVNNLFNVDATAVVTEQNTQAANEFRPNYKKGVGGVYEAYIRFLPNPHDPAGGSIVTKYTAFVTNYADNSQRMVDCPSTVGEPDPIQDTFFALRKSNNPQQVAASKGFSRSQRFASLVQILNCPSDTTINGKILVWSYGKKIHDKIQAEMNPANAMVAAKNPFNMLQGRPFYVKCKEVSGFNNFDDSGFFDAQQPMCVQVPFNGQMVAVDANSVQNAQFAQAVNTWLLETAPSLDPYMYHEWDDETRAFVANAIQAAKNPNVVVNQTPTAQVPGVQQFGQNFSTPTQPGAMPQMGGFGMPGMNSMPTAQPQMPGAMPQMGGMNMPQTAPAMSMPGMPTTQPQPAAPTAPQNTATTPGGFAASNIPDVNNIVNVGAPSAAAEAPVSGGINIEDVMNEIM